MIPLSLEQLQTAPAHKGRWSGSTPEERFWSYVKKNNSCWEWIGNRQRFGHGNMNINGIGLCLAHRISWVLHRGEIPDGLCVLHHCDSPSCVNPDHLYVGTISDNNWDREIRHRRNVRADRNPRAKLRWPQVREIRRRFDGTNTAGLAREFAVNSGTIWFIVRNLTWKEPVTQS